MPTPLTHAMVGAAAGLAAPGCFSRPKTALVLAGLSVAPDLDIIGFMLGVPYGDLVGHRGISHSLCCAAITGCVALLVLISSKTKNADSLTSDRIKVAVLVFAVVSSHGVLDALTNGGLGVGLLMPFVNQRLFFGVTPIEVCAISPSRLLVDATVVLKSEATWVWLPLAITGIVGVVLRTLRGTIEQKVWRSK